MTRVVRGIAIAVACLTATSACNRERRDTVGQPDISKSTSTTASSTRAAGAPLDLGDNDELMKYLDSLVQLGGTDAVVKWAERELEGFLRT